MKTTREDNNMESGKGATKRQRMVEHNSPSLVMDNPLVPYNDVDDEDDDERREYSNLSGAGKHGQGIVGNVFQDPGEEDDDDDDDNGDGQGSNQENRRSQIEPREDCPYLDTVNRQVLDFDFEKFCSVSLSNLNVYACLVCGKYFQGRGKKSHAYTHSLEAGHHVYINLQTEKVYCLPDGYEIIDPSLDDIRHVLNPRFTRDQVEQLDKNRQWSRALDGSDYLPGMVGLNNIKETDFVNVTIQSLMRVTPLRNFFLIPENYQHCRSPLVHRFGELTRKIWHARNFKGQVSPHEFLQAVMKASKKRFRIGQQSDPVEFMAWLLNTLHADLRTSKKNNSIIYECFQGELEVVKEIPSKAIADKKENNDDQNGIQQSADGGNGERERDIDKERGKEKNRERERERERGKEKEREKYKDREKEREIDKDRDREKGREKTKEREREADHEKERLREKDKLSKRVYSEDYDRSKDDIVELSYENSKDRDYSKQANASFDDDYEQKVEGKSGEGYASALALEERISKMKEERLKKNSEGSEVLAWVNRSRKLEEKKNSEKEKAKQLSKIFEEQDNIVQGDSEDEEEAEHLTHDLAGVKVLHGLEKVMEGGAVVLTLKDQSILADGDINEEVDKLENVEIGEQKRRDEAYKAAKKKTGIYDDKFNDDPTAEKKILPQYDDSAVDEGVTLDARGRFTGEAEKKLEELRRRLQGSSTNNRFEDLTAFGRISSDYYTQEEILQFKKPKKKKSLRKKEKLDINALEAEAVSAGLGVGDLGSRNDGRRQAIREEKERSEAEMRSNAYQSAYSKADEASKSLRLEQTLPAKLDEDENPVFADDDEDLYKSLERARKLALKKQEEEASGPQAIARLAATTTTGSNIVDDQNLTTAESQENKIVFTEMEEFVWGLQLDEEAHKPDNDDVFMDEDEAPSRAADQERKDEPCGWTEVKEIDEDENPVNENQEDIVPDLTIHEAPVGKGLSGALSLLKERGTLKESIEWGGRNMDKKKSKLVGIVDNDVDKNKDRFKDIRIERTDEFGRIMTPKEAFRMISHKFHGKGPGKMKQEKRMKQYQEELKLKQMKNSDTPSLSVERMREAQAQLKTPYLVLSGHVKPGQTSDPRSGFATVEKDLPGGLTPMLGDKKVEHFLGIKRQAEAGNSGMPKKPRT